MDREGFRNRMKQYKKAREENPGLKYWEWKDIPKYEDGTGNVEKQDNTRVASIEKEQVFIPATGELKRKQELLNKLSRNGQIKSGAIDIVSPEYDLLTGVRAITTLPTKAEKLGRKIFNSNFISDDEITDLINSKRISDLTTFTKKIKNDSDWYVHTDLGKSNSVFAGNGKGAYIQDRHLHPGEALIFDQKPYAWWNRGKRYARLGENEDGYLAIIIKGSNAKDLLQVNKSQNPIGQWNGKSGFVLQSEYVTQQPVNLTPDIEHYIYDGLTKTYGNVKHYKDGGEVEGDFLKQFCNQVSYTPLETNWWSDIKNWWNDMTGMKNYAYGNCATTPSGKHTKECAHYSNSVLRGQGYKNIVGDAWTRAANSGMKKITSGYDGLTKPTKYNEDDAKEYLQSAAENFVNKIDTTALKPFDVIGLYYPESPNTEKAFNKGAWGETQTHTGHVVIGEDGTHYVVHNVGGQLKMNKLADMLTLNYDYRPVSAYRPRK